MLENGSGYLTVHGATNRKFCLAREEQCAGVHLYTFLISECMESLKFKELADKKSAPKSVFNYFNSCGIDQEDSPRRKNTDHA